MIVTQRAARCSANHQHRDRPCRQHQQDPAGERGRRDRRRRGGSAQQHAVDIEVLFQQQVRGGNAVPPGAAAGACTLSCVGMVSASERYTAVRRIRSVRALMSTRSTACFSSSPSVRATAVEQRVALLRPAVARLVHSAQRRLAGEVREPSGASLSYSHSAQAITARFTARRPSTLSDSNTGGGSASIACLRSLRSVTIVSAESTRSALAAIASSRRRRPEVIPESSECRQPLLRELLFGLQLVRQHPGLDHSRSTSERRARFSRSNSDELLPALAVLLLLRELLGELLESLRCRRATAPSTGSTQGSCGPPPGARGAPRGSPCAPRPAWSRLPVASAGRAGDAGRRRARRVPS